MPELLTTRGASERLSEQLMERMASPGNVWGIPTGFRKLDNLTHGIQQEEMTVLMARPGVGKSALAGKIALNAAKHFKNSGSKKVVRLISLEMAWDSWVARLASYLSKVPIELALSGYLKNGAADAWNRALDELAQLPIECIDSGITLGAINQFVRQDNKCGLFIVDHIGITPGNDSNTSSYNSITAASTLYRELSKSVAPSIILSQMNRASELRQDRRPTLSDLYGSDRVSQDARKVIGLYRDDIYSKLSQEDREKPQAAEIIIIKNNNGRLGTIDAIFDPPSMNWTEVE